jgi:hypothetical protein
MSTTEPAGSPRPASTPLTRALVDDAAIFPPGNATLRDAVREHPRHRAARYGEAVGPLLLRLPDVGALEALVAGGPELSIGLVCSPDASADDVQRAITDAQRAGCAVRAIEQPIDRGAPLADMVALGRTHGARVWAEVPQASALDGSLGARLDDVAAAGAGAKYRTGSVRPEAFPTEQQLAQFLLACIDRNLPFKLTAGLHHAVRHTAAGAGEGGSDLEQHGLLNVVNAVAAAQGGADEASMVALLADRDAGKVATAAARLDDTTIGRVREAFVSFGCCGVTDPLIDLVTLGLLEPGLLDRPADKETS